MTVRQFLNGKFYESAGIFLLLALSAFLLALIVADVLAFRYYKPYVMTIPPTKSVEVQPVRDVSEYLASLSPFFRSVAGSASADMNAAGMTLESIAPDFPQDIALEATIVGDTAALAMIRTRGESKIYSSGDVVSPPMRVASVEADRVLLLSDKDDTRLTLHLKLGFTFENELPKSLLNNAGSRGGGGATFTGSSSTIEVSKREFEALLDPPSRIAAEVSLAPIARNGNPYGIRMSFVKPGSFIEKMGFRRGDILLSMNNKQLLTPEDGMMAYQTMKNEDSVDFKLDRGGSVMNIHINFK